MTGRALTFELVAAELRPLGVKIALEPGNYVLTYRGNPWGPRRDVDDLAEALALGRDMAENPPENAFASRWTPRRRGSGGGRRSPGNQPTAQPKGGRP